MGRVFVVELEGRVYKCKFCKTHLALAKDQITKGFQCRRGKAYLFKNAYKSSSKGSPFSERWSFPQIVLPRHCLHMKMIARIPWVLGSLSEQVVMRGFDDETPLSLFIKFLQEIRFSYTQVCTVED